MGALRIGALWLVVATLAKQQGGAAPRGERAASLEALLRWLREDPDAYLSNRQALREVAPGEFGIVATAPIAAGETLVVVPWHKLVAGKSLCESTRAIRDEMALGAASAVAPYLRALEWHAPGLPCTWTAAELKYVEPLPPYDWTRHTRWYADVCGGDPGDPAELRALELNVARAVGITGLEANAAGVVDQWTFMVPVYDLYNHRNGKWLNTQVEARWEEDFAMYARRDIAAGEELYNSYGDSAGQMLRDYGHVERAPALWDGLPGGHAFFVYEDGTIEWHSRVPGRARFIHDAKPLLDLTANDDDDILLKSAPPASNFATAREFRRALRFALLSAVRSFDFRHPTLVEL